MHWSDIDFQPSRRKLRQFAVAWLIALAAVTVWKVYQHGWTPLAVGLLFLALVVGTAGLIRPALIHPVYVGAMVATFPLGWLTSRLMFALVYYGLITPLAAALRLMGRDLLDRRRSPSQTSYWQPKPRVTDPRRYFRQF